MAAWSFSRWACWALCGLQYKLRYIDKLPEPQSPAMARGNDIHIGIAKYLEGKADAPPAEAATTFGAQLAELRALPNKSVEQKWAFNRQWRGTGYFAKDVYLRSVLDVGLVYDDNTADIIDHKTGKKYGSNTEQVELFALSAMCMWPQVTRVTARLWYIDADDEEIIEFSAADREKLKAKWDANASKMLSDTIFAPRPNDKCRFCNWSRSKGGPCKFG